MSEPESQVHLALALAEEKLSGRTKERDDVQLRLIKSDEQLQATQAELAESSKQNKETTSRLSVSNALIESKDLELAERTALLAASALELSQRTNQLHESNKYLLKKTAELERANAELKAMMQQRDDFIAAITHDLKNPLVGFTRIFEHLIAGTVPQEQQKDIFIQLLQSNNRMLRMIWNILEVYRHDAGSLVAKPEPVNPIELLQKCIEEFSFAIKTKKIELITDFPETDAEIKTDKILLQRLLINLLDNGVKFTPEEGVLKIGALLDESTLVVRIKDSGPGMTEEQTGLIFERFWQSKEGHDKGIGTGLGLFSSRQIARALKAEIECQSQINIGTQFTIKLPRAF